VRHWGVSGSRYEAEANSCGGAKGMSRVSCCLWCSKVVLGQNEAKRRNRHCIANWDSLGGEPLQKIIIRFVRKYISLVEPENSLSFHRFLSQMIPILTFTIFSREGELKLTIPN